MLDLVWKDVSAARRLLWLVLPVGGAQLAAMAFMPPIYVLGVLIFSALLAFGSLAVEETQQTELLWISLPLSRGQIVTARYLTTVLGTVAGLAIGWALANVLTRLAPAAADGPAELLSLDAHAVLLGFLVLVAAVYLPLYFRLGAGRGLLYFLAIAVAGLIIVSLVTKMILSVKGYPSPTADPEYWRAQTMRLVEWGEPKFGLLLTLYVGAAASAMGVSLLISRRAYETRDL